MHFRCSLTSLFVLCLCCTSCGGGSYNSDPSSEPNIPPVTPTVTPVPEPNETIFKETELWGDDVEYTRFEQNFKNEALKILRNNLGMLCYLYRESTIDRRIFDLSSWKTTLTCFNNNNEVILQRQFHNDGLIADFVFLDDGSLVVAELIKSTADDVAIPLFELQLSQFSELGQLLVEKMLVDAPTERELLYYNIGADELLDVVPLPDLTKNGRPQLPDNGLVNLHSHNGTLYLLAYTYGVKLYKMTANLDIEWDEQVMPAHSFLWTRLLQNSASLGFSGDNEPVVAVEVYQAEADIYAMHFQRDLQKTNGSADLIISQYSDSGSHKQSRLIGSPQYSEQLVGISGEGNTLWLGGNVRHNPQAPESNTGTQWDLWLAAYDIVTGNNLSYELIHIDGEDFSRDFHHLDSGHFIFAGYNGFNQADTNSQTTYAAGMVVEVDAQGNVLNSASLKDPRNVYLNGCQVNASGEVLFAGSHNGPITHTCDTDDSLCFQDGMVGRLNLGLSND